MLFYSSKPSSRGIDAVHVVVGDWQVWRCGYVRRPIDLLLLMNVHNMGIIELLDKRLSLVVLTVARRLIDLKLCYVRDGFHFLRVKTLSCLRTGHTQVIQ